MAVFNSLDMGAQPQAPAHSTSTVQTLLSINNPFKFIAFLLLPYILIGCSRDGPPYRVVLNATIMEQARSIRTKQIMRIGVYRDGGLSPFDRSVCWSHFYNDSTGTAQIRLELPQPPEYYTLLIDSLPPGYVVTLVGASLNHKRKQNLILFVHTP
jgi:hypothetical protein